MDETQSSWREVWHQTNKGGRWYALDNGTDVQVVLSCEVIYNVDEGVAICKTWMWNTKMNFGHHLKDFVKIVGDDYVNAIKWGEQLFIHEADEAFMEKTTIRPAQEYGLSCNYDSA